ncbi:MAG: hypothetical protein IKH01_09360 [Prevotella sp.]|nr:hypothetical protein [Prevotella sp.]
MHRIYLDGQGHKVAAPVSSKEQYFAIRNSVSNRENLMKAHQGDEEAKRRLVQFNYNDLLPDGRLAGCCHPSSYFAGDVDCTGLAASKQIAQRFLEHKDEIGLMELSRSARYGLHYVCRRQMGRTILENQVRVAQMTKTEMDTSAHDLQRVMFTVTADADELLYLDEALFQEPLTIEESEREYELLRERERAGLEEAPAGAKKQNKHYRPWEEESTQKEPSPLCTSSKTFNGVPYADIVSEWWRQHGGEPKEGVRNIALHKLAVHLRGICDNRQELLLQVMPRLGLSDAELRSIIASACKEQPKGLTLEMKAVLKALTPSESTQKEPSLMCTFPPEMPRRLPKLIKLLTSKTPDIYKPTVAQAVFPALATHLWQVKFEYIDGVMHQATLMNVVMAETGAGKSCIDKPIQAIMADIAARDKANLAREKAWKDEVNSKGANKDKAKRPEGLVIQQIDADMTNAAFVMRLDESEGHFLYLKINEIQQLDALKGNGKAGQQFQVICLAFDPNSEYGQTRVGTMSISARVQVLFNFNACTTVNKGRQYFRNVLVDGPISRINFCTIPEQPIGSPIPKYGKYDAQFAEELKPFIDNLCAARGEIYCPEAYKLAKKLDDELKQKAIESQNRTYENLSFRANVIAYLKACVLYVANGCKWEKSIEDFVRWSLNYDLWCKMEFFGDAITQANRFNGPSHNQPKSLLEDLSPVFTREDVKNLYIKKGMDTSKVAQTIRMWKHRNLIIEQPDGTYKQLRYAA